MGAEVVAVVAMELKEEVVVVVGVVIAGVGGGEFVRWELVGHCGALHRSAGQRGAPKVQAQKKFPRPSGAISNSNTNSSTTTSPTHYFRIHFSPYNHLLLFSP